MLGYIKHQTPDRLVQGVSLPLTSQRTSWLRRVQTVWSQWLFQPWPPLWILKGDRSLCQVRALHYYLDKDFRPQTEQRTCLSLLEERLQQKYISCHYLIIDQATCDLCYMSSLIKSPLHYIRLKPMILQSSKASQSKCLLRSYQHVTGNPTTQFTQFYLKDVAWDDSELFHMGPVVAAQLHKALHEFGKTSILC